MFWGLIMEPQKRYSQVVKKAFHISHAAMDTTTGENEPCQVMVVISGKNFLLCTLQKNKTIQTALDLYFREGDEICFFTNGKCHIHLTGYLDPEFDEEEGEEEEEEEASDDDVPTLIPQSKKDKKRKLEDVSPEVPLTKKQRKEQARLKREQEESKTAKKEDSDSDDDSDDSSDLKKLLEADDDSDANDDSYMPNESNVSSVADDSDDDDDEDEDDDDEDDDDDDEQSTPQSSPAKKKNDQSGKKQVPTPQQNGHTDKVDKKKNKENEKKLNQSEKSESVEKSPQDAKQKKVLPGNVAIEDLRVGQGAAAKSGKMVEVFYEGRLKSNNKMFDSCMKKPGFKFRLGKKEVISGWDIGITGMKIGGKRRIVCPPGMAYGNKGSPPVIPPNSTLVFEVELKGVN